MPAGHTNTTPAGGLSGAASSPLDDFARDFLNDIMPYAEAVDWMCSAAAATA